MNGQKRLFLTTLNDAMDGQAREKDPNIATCEHFSDLFYNVEGGHHERHRFFEALNRLAGILRAEGSPVVILGAWFPDVPNATLEIARYLFEHSNVRRVVVIATQPRDSYSMRLQVFSITPRGLSLVHHSEQAHRDDFLKIVLAKGRGVYQRLYAEDDTSASQ